MKNNAGKAFVQSIVIIAILVVIGFVAYKAAVGRGGIIRKFTTDEEKYSKTEVLEEINFIITEKYLDAYSKATKDGKNKVEEFYNAEKVIAYLKGYSGGEDGNINYSEAPDQKVIIEDLVSEENCYFVKVENLKSELQNYGKGENTEDSNDYFFIKQEGDKFILYYKDINSEIEQIGEIQIEQSI